LLLTAWNGAKQTVSDMIVSSDLKEHPTPALLTCAIAPPLTCELDVLEADGAAAALRPRPALAHGVYGQGLIAQREDTRRRLLPLLLSAHVRGGLADAKRTQEYRELCSGGGDASGVAVALRARLKRRAMCGAGKARAWHTGQRALYVALQKTREPLRALLPRWRQYQPFKRSAATVHMPMWTHHSGEELGEGDGPVGHELRSYVEKQRHHKKKYTLRGPEPSQGSGSTQTLFSDAPQAKHCRSLRCIRLFTFTIVHAYIRG
jgi:hypothetical protein